MNEVDDRNNSRLVIVNYKDTPVRTAGWAQLVGFSWLSSAGMKENWQVLFAAISAPYIKYIKSFVPIKSIYISYIQALSPYIFGWQKKSSFSEKPSSLDSTYLNKYFFPRAELCICIPKKYIKGFVPIKSIYISYIHALSPYIFGWHKSVFFSGEPSLLDSTYLNLYLSLRAELCICSLKRDIKGFVSGPTGTAPDTPYRLSGSPPVLSVFSAQIPNAALRYASTQLRYATHWLIHA